jgi:hypothetical protein
VSEADTHSSHRGIYDYEPTDNTRQSKSPFDWQQQMEPARDKAKRFLQQAFTAMPGCVSYRKRAVTDVPTPVTAFALNTAPINRHGNPCQWSARRLLQRIRLMVSAEPFDHRCARFVQAYHIDMSAVASKL